MKTQDPPLWARVGKVVASVWRLNTLRLVRLFLRGVGSPCWVKIPLFGRHLVVDLGRCDVERLLYLEGERFVEERHFVSGLARGCRSIVDVGANIGYYTLLFAQAAAPFCRIICVEPSIENLPELEATLDLNRLPNTTLHRVALGAGRSRTGLKAGINSGVTSIGQGQYEVEVMPLDDLISEPVEFIKIDVEGYEHEVLRGGRRVLAEYHPLLLVELHPRALERFGASVGECLALLREHYGEIEFFEGAIPLLARQNAIRHFCCRVAAPYSCFRPIRQVWPTEAQIRGLDADLPWGTLWVVCRPTAQGTCKRGER